MANRYLKKDRTRVHCSRMKFHIAELDFDCGRKRELLPRHYSQMRCYYAACAVLDSAASLARSADFEMAEIALTTNKKMAIAASPLAFKTILTR